MAIILKKRDKYLRSSSYCTGFGTDYRWTRNESEARRYSDDSPYAELTARATGAKLIRVENTKRELKALARERMSKLNRLPLRTPRLPK